MIGVYAGLSVKPEHVEEFLKTIEPLVTASRKDEGNVSYDFGAVSETEFAFIERWESQLYWMCTWPPSISPRPSPHGSRCSPPSWTCVSSTSAKQHLNIRCPAPLPLRGAGHRVLSPEGERTR